MDSLRERLRKDEDIAGVIVDTVSSMPAYTLFEGTPTIAIEPADMAAP